MSYNLSNVSISADTFATWIEKTNLGLDVISTIAVTTAANTKGGWTTGNSYINGISSANTLVAVTNLRGGNVGTSNTLVIVSSTDVQNTFINSVSINANLTISAASGRTANVNAPTELRANVQVTSGAANLYINSTKVNFVTTNTDLYGTELNVYNNTAAGSKVLNIVSGSNNVTFTTNTYIINNSNTITANSGNVTIQSSNTTIGNSSIFGVRVTNDGTTTAVTIAGNSSNIASNLMISAANVDIRNVTFFSTNTTFGGSGNLVIGTTWANVSSNVYASGANLTLTSATTLNLLGNVFFTSDVQHVVVSNTNLGVNVSTAQTVYSFLRDAYSAAEITAVAKKGPTGTSTQISRFLVAYDLTSNVVLSTMYGSISSNATANVGILQTSVNATAVAIGYYQNTANSSVKLILNLIK